jgi:hypothetical protein
MPLIFMSYKRGDASGYAGRLFDRLNAHFGDGGVFMDVSAMEPGNDWVEALGQAVARCDAMVVVIGPDWKPTEFVSAEIAQGLKLGHFIIPVLVGGATMRKLKGLPRGIANLSTRHALQLPNEGWGQAVDHLIGRIEAARVAAASPQPEQPLAPSQPTVGDLASGRRRTREALDWATKNPPTSRHDQSRLAFIRRELEKRTTTTVRGGTQHLGLTDLVNLELADLISLQSELVLIAKRGANSELARLKSGVSACEVRCEEAARAANARSDALYALSGPAGWGSFWLAALAIMLWPFTTLAWIAGKLERPDWFSWRMAAFEFVLVLCLEFGALLIFRGDQTNGTVLLGWGMALLYPACVFHRPMRRLVLGRSKRAAEGRLELSRQKLNLAVASLTEATQASERFECWSRHSGDL